MSTNPNPNFIDLVASGEIAEEDKNALQSDIFVDQLGGLDTLSANQETITNAEDGQPLDLSYLSGDREWDSDSTRLYQDSQKFTTGQKIYYGAGSIAASINRGTWGLVDLPISLYNNIAEAAETYTPIPDDFFPKIPYTRDTIFSTHTGDEDLNKLLRPINAGVEVASSFIIPSGVVMSNVARQGTKGITRREVRNQPFLGKGEQIVLPSTMVSSGKFKASTTSQELAQDLTGNVALDLFGGRMSSIMAGTTAITTAAASKMFEDDPKSQAIAEMTAAFTTPFAAYLGGNFASKSWNSYQFYKSNKNPKNKTIAAVNVIAQYAENPTLAYRNLMEAFDKGNIGNLAVMTKDEGIAQFLKHLKNKKSDLDGVPFNIRLLEIDDKSARYMKDTLDTIGEEAATKYFRNFMEGREDAIIKSIQQNIVDEAEKARTALQLAQGNVDDFAKLSIDFKKSLQNAKDAAFEELNKVWATVPKPFVSKERVKKWAEGVLKGEKYANDQEKNLVGKVFDESLKTFLKTIDEKGRISVDDLMTFRSGVLEKVRNNAASENPNARLQKFGNGLADDALNLIISAPGKGEKYRQAATLTRNINQIFDNIDLRSSAERVANNVLLMGQKNSQGLDELLKAGGYDKGVEGGLQDLMRRSFASTLDSDPITGELKINIQKANTFLKNNREVLSRYPKMREEFEEAVSTGAINREIQKNAPKTLAEREKHAFNLFAREKVDYPHQAIDLMFNTKNPKVVAKQLVDYANVDESGMALKGLQRNVVESFFNKAFIFKPDGTLDTVSSMNPQKFKEYKDAANIIFSDNPEAIKLFDDVMDQVYTMQRVNKAKSINVEITTGFIKDALLRVAGISLGTQTAKVTGGQSLMMANTGSRVFKQLLGERPIEQQFKMMQEVMLNPQQYVPELKAALTAPKEADMLIRTNNLVNALIQATANSKFLLDTENPNFAEEYR